MCPRCLESFWKETSYDKNSGDPDHFKAWRLPGLEQVNTASLGTGTNGSTSGTVPASLKPPEIFVLPATPPHQQALQNAEPVSTHIDPNRLSVKRSSSLAESDADSSEPDTLPKEREPSRAESDTDSQGRNTLPEEQEWDICAISAEDSEEQDSMRNLSPPRPTTNDNTASLPLMNRNEAHREKVEDENNGPGPVVLSREGTLQQDTLHSHPTPHRDSEDRTANAPIIFEDAPGPELAGDETDGPRPAVLTSTTPARGNRQPPVNVCSPTLEMRFPAEPALESFKAKETDAAALGEQQPSALSLKGILHSADSPEGIEMPLRVQDLVENMQEPAETMQIRSYAVDLAEADFVPQLLDKDVAPIAGTALTDARAMKSVTHAPSLETQSNTNPAPSAHLQSTINSSPERQPALFRCMSTKPWKMHLALLLISTKSKNVST